MSTLLAIVVDTTIIIGVALATCRFMTRRPAALRHAILAAAILGATAMPLLEVLVPPVAIAHIPLALASSSSIGVAASGSKWASSDGPSTLWGPPSGGPLTPTQPAAASAVATTASAATTPWFDVAEAIIAVWILGTVMNLVAFLLGLLKLRRLTARCVLVRAGRWRERADEFVNARQSRRGVDILQSDDPALLVTCGVLRPKIVLPAGADAWTDERVRIVLAHELAHVRQQDGALQIAGELLRALHWFNPLVWLACHRLRQESEYAADDAVLNAGTDASDYASQLLAVARHARGLNRAWVAAPGIAHPSTLERRITAMLNPRRNRGPLTRRTVAATSLAAVIVVIPLAACSVARTTDPLTPPAAVGRDVALQAAPLADYRKARLEAFFHPATHAGRRAEAAAEGGSPGIDTSTPRAVASPNPAASTANANAANAAVAAPQAGAAADDQSGTFVGSVKDATGAVLPGATVTMTSTDLQVQRQTTSDANGSFMFRNLAPAQYAIAVSLAGFDTITAVMAVPPRLMVGRSFALPLGEITQNVTVRCGTQAAAVSSTNDATDSTRARSEALDRLYDALRRITQQVSPTLSAQSAPVRVGGQIQPPRKIADVLPVCPAPPDMDTSVVLVGRIGTDGALRGVRPITPRPANASPSQALVQSAVDAVNQWMFTPALLNGQKVEVDVTIQVTFRPGTVVHISLF